MSRGIYGPVAAPGSCCSPAALCPAATFAAHTHLGCRSMQQCLPVRLPRVDLGALG